MLRYIIKPIGYMVLSMVLPQCVMANVQLPNHRLWPTTWYLGIDVAKTCVGWYQKTGSAYEIHNSIDFHPILLDVDYGLGQIQRDGRRHNGSFASARGQYFRVGLGYNFLTPTAHHNQFFIGLRYVRSFFDFQLESNKFQCNHPPNKACSIQVCVAPIALRRSKGSAIVHWWEVVAGGKVSLMRALSIGCTMRYKFNKKIENKLLALPFDIPGFGLASFDHAFGYSLYVLLRIPLQQNKQVSCGNVAQKSVT